MVAEASLSRKEWFHLPSDFLRSSLLKLQFVHSPNSSFHILHSHKALVEAEVMPYCILQAKEMKALKFQYVACCWADLIKHNGDQTLKQQQSTEK